MSNIALPEAEFQTKVLETVEKVKTSQEELLSNYENLDKTTKSAIEELTIVKDKFSGLDSEIKAFELALKKTELRLKQESALATHGTTMTAGQRIARDKDKARVFFADIAHAIDRPDLAAKALGEDTSPGSTMIRDGIASDIYDSLLRFGAWSSLGVRPVGTKITKFPVKTARPVANFVLTEADTIADDTNKAGTSLNLEVEVVAVLLNVSLQLLEDAEFDVVADVVDDFIQALNYRLDYASFQGAGTSNAAQGGITGVYNFGTAATADATRITVAATKYTDWLKCLTAVDAEVLNRPARWWIHPSLAAAAVAVQDSNGRPIFQTALEAPGGGILNMFGYPVTLVGAAPSTNAASAKIAAFGDPRAFAVGLRRGITVEASEHFRWNTLERSFRGYTRFGAVGLKASALTVLTLPAS